ncbi:alcohol dehydrogenase catalytic domain-containing protein [Clostridium sp. HMP27]|uniref:alcohol dehydrogenase catalytic domain-containing protein n=1 Tax=Clostridium sp. HMP27 TaxID=1487921 RepID=UPI00052BE171|nr:alcohol dehydrogenase catalytic domain-containing protein [Clostridium sp. HMP27]KGK86063.1 hypothetical protein DP68_14665 [Clostridium sp. HMP27]
MLSKGFKICEPMRFDIYIENVLAREDEVIVKIDAAAICKADLRYYSGKRDKRVLDLKYPMNLLHEAVGTVIKDNSNEFSIGDKVVLVPNIASKQCGKCNYKICDNRNLGQNYCPDAKFASSNCDGFSREYVSYPAGNVVLLPENLKKEIAVFSELASVAYSVYRRIDLKDNDVVAIFGDGTLSYILCCVLKKFFKGKILVVGKHEEKLNQFPVEDKIILEHINKIGNFDIAYECVGGNKMEEAIDSIVNYIAPGGKVVLNGVADSNISISTRKILEKGLSFYGVTRSNVEDFKKSVLLFEDEKFRTQIEKLILNIKTINDIIDFYNVFDYESKNKQLGKVVMNFNF